MSKLVESLGINRLSIQERLDLIDEIWETIPHEIRFEDIPEDQLEEIKRRREEARANPGVGQPWREVIAEIERRS